MGKEGSCASGRCARKKGDRKGVKEDAGVASMGQSGLCDGEYLDIRSAPLSFAATLVKFSPSVLARSWLFKHGGFRVFANGVANTAQSGE